MQPQGQLQVVANLADWDELKLPWTHPGGGLSKGRQFFEQAVPPHVAQTLTDRGHNVSVSGEEDCLKGSGYPATKPSIDGGFRTPCGWRALAW